MNLPFSLLSRFSSFFRVIQKFIPHLSACNLVSFMISLVCEDVLSSLVGSKMRCSLFCKSGFIPEKKQSRQKVRKTR